MLRLWESWALLVAIISPRWTMSLRSLLHFCALLNLSVLLTLLHLVRARMVASGLLCLAVIIRVPAAVPALAARLRRSQGPCEMVPVGVRLFGLGVRGDPQ